LLERILHGLQFLDIEFSDESDFNQLGSDEKPYFPVEKLVKSFYQYVSKPLKKEVLAPLLVCGAMSRQALPQLIG
jgi:hypothetical protein